MPTIVFSLPAVSHFHLRELYKVRGPIGLGPLFADLVRHTLPSRAGIQKLGNFDSPVNQGATLPADLVEHLDRLAASPSLMPLLVNKGRPFPLMKPNRSRTMAALIASAYVAECDHVTLEAEENKRLRLVVDEHTAQARAIALEAMRQRAAQKREQAAAADRLQVDMAAALAEALK